MIETAQACQIDRWNHTAALMALIANVNRDPKRGRPFKPVDFHPALPERLKRAGPAAPPRGDIGMLKIFVS